MMLGSRVEGPGASRRRTSLGFLHRRLRLPVRPVLVATAIGAIWYQQTTPERARVSAEASSLHARADGLWTSHLQGDQRSATAGVFVALAPSL